MNAAVAALPHCRNAGRQQLIATRTAATSLLGRARPATGFLVIGCHPVSATARRRGPEPPAARQPFTHYQIIVTRGGRPLRPTSAAGYPPDPHPCGNKGRSTAGHRTRRSLREPGAQTRLIARHGVQIGLPAAATRAHGSPACFPARPTSAGDSLAHAA